MKTTITRTILVTAVSLLALAQNACDKASTPDEATETTQTATDPKIEAVFLKAAPEGAAATVIEARKTVEPGATITVGGRIGGALQPFSADYATLVLLDESIMTCERNPGDMCETPWDACCVELKVIAASRLTVQILGEDGRPIEQSLKEIRGLKELDGLVVTGTVAEGSSAENLILNATGIFVAKSH